MIEILSRKEKNNVMILGEAGVGKTVMIDLLTQRICDGNVPMFLRDKEILRINLGELLSGSKYRGEFEEKVSELLTLVKNSHGKVILFIDEFHNALGA